MELFDQVVIVEQSSLTRMERSNVVRCENCEGLGYVANNMLFFEDLEVVCPVCNGNQFNNMILSIKYKM